MLLPLLLLADGGQDGGKRVPFGGGLRFENRFREFSTKWAEILTEATPHCTCGCVAKEYDEYNNDGFVDKYNLAKIYLDMVHILQDDIVTLNIAGAFKVSSILGSVLALAKLKGGPELAYSGVMTFLDGMQVVHSPDLEAMVKYITSDEVSLSATLTKDLCDLFELSKVSQAAGSLGKFADALGVGYHVMDLYDAIDGIHDNMDIIKVYSAKGMELLDSLEGLDSLDPNDNPAAKRYIALLYIRDIKCSDHECECNSKGNGNDGEDNGKADKGNEGDDDNNASDGKSDDEATTKNGEGSSGEGGSSLFKEQECGRQRQMIEDAKLAATGYSDSVGIPAGYRAATQDEFNEMIGTIWSEANKPMVRYDPNSGHFSGVGGFNGSLLVSEADGGVVLAFGGTEGNPLYSMSDIWNDVRQFLGGVPVQYELAETMLVRLVSHTSEKALPIKVVGHSLGGGLAVYATMWCDTSRVTTTTFNAAGICTALNEGNLRNLHGVISNVRIDGELVSRTGVLLGDTYEVTNYMPAYAITHEETSWLRTGTGLVTSEAYAKWLKEGFESVVNWGTDKADLHLLSTIVNYMEMDYMNGPCGKLDNDDEEEDGEEEDEPKDEQKQEEEEQSDEGGAASDGGAGGDSVSLPEDDLPSDGLPAGDPPEANWPVDDTPSGEVSPVDVDWSRLPDGIGVPLPDVGWMRTLYLFSGEDVGTVLDDLVKPGSNWRGKYDAVKSTVETSLKNFQ